MSKHFRPWNIDQTLLLPPNVRDFVPKDHVSRFIVGLVRESLDLKAIMCSYVSGLGQPPFDPRMMVSLLLHGYASGLYSSRRIARACSERNDFVMIVALDPPDFRTISDFRKRHLKALGELFLQVLPYRLRKQVVEPVFGQIKQARGFRQFLLRGVKKVRAEWAMICTTHNLLKLFTLAKAA